MLSLRVRFAKFGMPPRGAQPDDATNATGPGLGRTCDNRIEPMTDFMAESIRRHQAHSQNSEKALRAYQIAVWCGDVPARLRALNALVDAKLLPSIGTPGNQQGSVVHVDFLTHTHKVAE